MGFAFCKKEDKGPKFPEPTHKGKNIIAWKMDGKVYVSKGSEYFAPNHSYYSLYYDATLKIHGETKEPNLEIGLECVYLGLNTPLQMREERPYFGYIREYITPAGSALPTGTNEYSTDNTHRGSIIVTYYDSTIIAGTFQMDVVNDAGQVHHITEGRFDISRERCIVIFHL